ncbi:MAG: hypothetical protein V1706_00145 [Pseudomonadota bacterium]
MFTIDDLYFSNVSRKLACARSIYDETGPQLLSLPLMREKLARITLLTSRLQEHMAAMGMFSRCTTCGEKNGGGCCSAFMANETDSVQLLLNLLLGIEVTQRNDLLECCYLGSRGCIFTVKPIFCLNYNCHHILKNSEKKILCDLEIFASAVLQEQTILEKLLLEQIVAR